MSVLICPGVHEAALTQSFLASLQASWHQEAGQIDHWLVYPAEQYPAYSAMHVLYFLQQELGTPDQKDLGLKLPLVLIAFSAGVVSAIGTAWAWQQMGGTVKALIALDGWGVPLYGNFPIHRMSHDSFTHWSSALLGTGEDSFYADPAVEHLQLWRSPQTTQGYWVSNPPSNQQSRSPQSVSISAAVFITVLLERYGELESPLG